MKSKHFAFLAVAGLLLALSACSGQPAAQDTGSNVIHATLTEYAVELDKTSVPAGTIKFEIDNIGEIMHELVLEPAGAHDEPFEANGVESEAEDIEGGATASFEWTLEPGTYQLSCYVEGHFEKGMFTTFTVE